MNLPISESLIFTLRVGPLKKSTLHRYAAASSTRTYNRIQIMANLNLELKIVFHYYNYTFEARIDVHLKLYNTMSNSPPP